MTATDIRDAELILLPKMKAAAAAENDLGLMPLLGLAVAVEWIMQMDAGKPPTCNKTRGEILDDCCAILNCSDYIPHPEWPLTKEEMGANYNDLMAMLLEEMTGANP